MTDKLFEQHMQIINSTINTGIQGIDPEFGVSFEPDDVITEIDQMLALYPDETATEENSPYVFWSKRLGRGENMEEFVEACREMVLDYHLWALFKQIIHNHLWDAQQALLKKELDGNKS